MGIIMFVGLMMLSGIAMIVAAELLVHWIVKKIEEEE